MLAGAGDGVRDRESGNGETQIVTAELDRAAADFARMRPRLFGIAYRMLGSAAEAEDVVQDAWLRWQAYDRETVIDPQGFLATTTTRLAINAAQSARTRRETYVGPWLPEPIDISGDPALGAERGEALELAVLLLLEHLTPTERAAYVLREAFDYPYRQIADILQTTEPATRQLVSRARKHLAAGRRTEVAPLEHQRLLQAFVAAAQVGDLPALEQLLAADVVSYSDGGGLARAARFPIHGRTRVAKVVRAYAPRFWADVELDWIEANGQPAVLVSRAGSVVALITVSVSAQGIGQILWMLNPRKLGRMAP